MRLCPESSEMSCPRGTGGDEEEGKELTYFTLLSSFGCFRVLPWLLAGSARVRRVGVESMNGYCWGWLENLRLWWRLMEVFMGTRGGAVSLPLFLLLMMEVSHHFNGRQLETSFRWRKEVMRRDNLVDTEGHFQFRN